MPAMPWPRGVGRRTLVLVPLLAAWLAACSASNNQSAQSPTSTAPDEAPAPVAVEAVCQAIDTKIAAKLLTGYEGAIVAAAPLRVEPPQQAGCELANARRDASLANDDVVRVVLAPAKLDGTDAFQEVAQKPGVAPLNINGQRMVYDPNAQTLYVQFRNTNPLIGGTAAGVDSLLLITCANSIYLCDTKALGTADSPEVLFVTQTARHLSQPSQTPQTGRTSEIKDYAGTWQSRTTTLEVRPDLTGTSKTSMGVCGDLSSGVRCSAVEEVKFVPTANGLIGFTVSVTYKSSEDRPLSSNANLPSTKTDGHDSFRLVKVGDGLYATIVLRSAGLPRRSLADLTFSGATFLCGASVSDSRCG